ncbi:MAG: geranylgeranyl reductase family protein [Betaproteobacteria bacterium]|nr:geranylgeranyl reductase family protein [Betaproteobacteria bacterium]
MTAPACDVLVAGLGPAGAAAAAVAAGHGLSVIAVDKKRTVGVPVQCAEFIPLPLARHARAAGVLAQRVDGMRSFLPSGVCAAAPFQGLMVDRAAFDRALAESAARAGAALRLDCRLAALDAARGRATVRSRAGAVMTIAFRVLIAADGPLSMVARALKLPALETVDSRQYSVRLSHRHGETDVWLSDTYPGGYAWLFPKGDVANLGVGVDKRRATDLKAPLDTLHARLVREGRVGREILSRTGGPIPVGGMREQLVAGNIVFVGDAAGLTHPITGAGIAAAVVSGERAGEAAQALIACGDTAALRDYEEDIRDQFAESSERALARRRELSRAWNAKRAREDAVQRRGWIAFPEYFGRSQTDIGAHGVRAPVARTVPA